MAPYFAHHRLIKAFLLGTWAYFALPSASAQVLLWESFDNYATGSRPTPPWDWVVTPNNSPGVEMMIDEIVSLLGKSAHFVDTTTSAQGTLSQSFSPSSHVVADYFMRTHDGEAEGAFAQLRGDAGSDYVACFANGRIGGEAGWIGIYSPSGWAVNRLLRYEENIWYYVRRELDCSTNQGSFYVEELIQPLGHPENPRVFHELGRWPGASNTVLNRIHILTSGSQRADCYIDELRIAEGGQPLPRLTTTIITHGYDPEVGFKKPDWALEMAEEIAAVAGTGTVYGYEPMTGEWEFRRGTGLNDHVVLVVNWTEESDIIKPTGRNWKFAEAAADAFYAALRDPWGDLAGVDVLRDRAIHLIGHSRGASVNSELARRLLSHGAVRSIDQVTTLDAHPVNGGLCPWGDPVPSHWIGVDWADNYFQGSYSPCEFPPLDIPDGLSLSGTHESDLSAVDWNNVCSDHSNVHAWYHGTIAGSEIVDGCEIHADWYEGTNPANPACNAWDCQGFYYSALGAGFSARPSIPIGTEEPIAPPVLFNGEFDIENGRTFAGWWYHGGGGDGEVIEEGGKVFMQLDAPPFGSASHLHNRFFLPCGAAAVEVVIRLISEPQAGDLLALDLTRDDRPDCRVGSIDLEGHWATYGAAWISYAFSLDAPCVEYDRSWGIELEAHANSEGVVVAVDRVQVQMHGGDPCDANCDGVVDAFDIEPLVNLLVSPNPIPCSSCAGDANRDGTINAFDIEPFINCLVGP